MYGVIKKGLGRTLPFKVDFVFGPNGAIGDAHWIADVPCELVYSEEIHNAAGTDAGAVTLDLEKLTGTTTIGSGSTMLASTYNLKSAANTVVRKSKANAGLTTTLANRRLAIGNRLGLNVAGTITTLAGVHVRVIFVPLGPPTNW